MDLTLRSIKMKSHSVGSLNVLDHHLWLNLTVMKDPKKILLDTLVDPTGLLGDVVFKLSIFVKHRYSLRQ